MIVSILFLVILTGVNSTPITKGEVVTDIKAYPYVVRLTFLGRVLQDGKKVLHPNLCTGILVKPDFVVTAAHCIVDIVEKPFITVKAGAVDLVNGKTLQTRVVKDYRKHANYDGAKDNGLRKPFAAHDIAVLWLNEKLKIGPGVKVARLESALPSLTNVMGVAVGWGSTSKELLPKTLQKIKMIVKSKDFCEGITINRLNNQFCTTGKSFPDNGDSGGPFVVNNVVVGISSWMNNDRMKLAIYVRVYPYVEWIENNYKRGPPSSITQNHKPGKLAPPINLKTKSLSTIKSNGDSKN